MAARNLRAKKINQYLSARAHRSPPINTVVHCQLLFPIELQKELVVHKVPLASERQLKAWIPEAAALMRQRLQRPSRLPWLEIVAP
ncbi:hypothetical protein CQ055_10520 [Brucella pseudogrignonensis]|nr:hypothetical protein CQ063_10635 [Brucella pseudogrignonensis]PRA69806.1 hypothetical protein CQ055_10520 [Brucella pseudogrignonensis]